MRINIEMMAMIILFVLTLAMTNIEKLKALSTNNMIDTEDGGDDLTVGIRGGLKIPKDELTFAVALDIAIQIKNLTSNSTTNRTVRCSGSLISDRIILTAGHCLQNKSEDDETKLRRIIGIVLGTWDLSNPYRAIEEGDNWVSVLIHPERDSGRFDMAIVILTVPTELDQHVFPVALARDLPAVDTPVTVAGFGKTSCESRKRNRYLRYASIYIKNQVICAMKMSALSIGADPDGLLPHPDDDMRHAYETLLCAGNDSEENAQHGDSGGPLFSGNHSEYNHPLVLEGLVTSGPGCKNKLDMVWYSGIAHFVDWIREATNCSDCYDVAVRCYKCSSGIDDFCGDDFRPDHPLVETVTCISKYEYSACWYKTWLLENTTTWLVSRGCDQSAICMNSSNDVISCESAKLIHSTSNCSQCCSQGAFCNSWAIPRPTTQAAIQRVNARESSGACGHVKPNWLASISGFVFGLICRKRANSS